MSFSQGVSGINAASTTLDTIGNNIANSQTVGYKSSRTEFADIYAGAKAGLGVKVSGVTQGFSTGSMTSTDRNLDVAINGGGFFRVTDGTQIMYSRNGQFQMDSNGYLVNGQGAELTGYNISDINDPNAVLPNGGNPEAIQIPSSSMAASATTSAAATYNLNSSADAITADFDPNNVDTYTDTSTVKVYDSQGNGHDVQLYFAKTDANNWNVYARYADGTDANGTVYKDAFNNGSVVASDGTYKSQQVEFDSSGRLITPANPATLAFTMDDLSTGAADLDFNLDLTGTTQFANDFVNSALTQNGYTSGDLTGISIGQDGTISASYSNEKSLDVARIVLADFRNEQGLKSVGDNAWVETASSGPALTGQPGSGQIGELLSSTLEESNVDLSQELVNMIVAQRNYQANAQTIKTQDQVLQTLVTMR